MSNYHRKVVPGWKNIQVGPFIGGMNLASDPSALKDNELVDCFNCGLDLDGSLIVRPPLKNYTTGVPASTTRMRALKGVTINGNSYIIFANDTTVWAFNGSGTWTQLVTGIYASSATQYKEKVYIVAGASSTVTGGNWDGTTYTNIATMPKGDACLIWQERMWIADGAFTAKLSFSAIADPTTWNSTDFFQVAPGDGSRLRDLIIFNNNLLLFKEESVYALSYNTKPADAIISKISNTVGASGLHCVTIYQNVIYVYHQGDIYQMVNLNFVQINNRVPFQYDASSPSGRSDNVFMCMLGQRLVIKYYNNYYVYDTLVQTWSRWYSGDADMNQFGYLVMWPQNSLPDVVDRYFGGSCLTTVGKVFQINDGYTSTDTETPLITFGVKTKDYDIGLSWKYKRLFFWGADVLTNRAVTGTVTPIVFNYSITWNDIKTTAWSTLQTWQQPTTKSLSVVTNNTAGAGTLKRFLKFNKSVRFRVANFQISLQSDGSTTDGPGRFYWFTLFLAPHETAVKAVS